MKNFKNETTINRLMDAANYSTVSNAIIANTNLTDASVRVLIRMLNNNENYVINSSLIQKELKYSNDKMSSVIKNLIENGYLIKERIKNNKNQFTGWTYIVNESPISDFPKVGNPESRDSRKSGNPKVGKSETNNTNINNINLNNNKENKINEKNVGMSTDISTGQKYYSDEDFGCETPTTSTPTPIVEYKEEKKKDDLYIQRESFKQKGKTLYTIQLLGLIDSTFPQNIDEKTTENRNTFHSYYSRMLNQFETEIDEAKDTNKMNELYASFQQIISGGTNKMADFQIKKETIENTKKEHNCSDSTAEKVYLLFKEVVKMGGTSECIRFKNKVNRIISKADGYKSEWIQNDAKEVVADPNLQMKF